eukprot:scaffold1068_cov375-Prasinococcus_capsulatus_cf.AAC.27
MQVGVGDEVQLAMPEYEQAAAATRSEASRGLRYMLRRPRHSSSRPSEFAAARRSRRRRRCAV